MFDFSILNFEMCFYFKNMKKLAFLICERKKLETANLYKIYIYIYIGGKAKTKLTAHPYKDIA